MTKFQLFQTTIFLNEIHPHSPIQIILIEYRKQSREKKRFITYHESAKLPAAVPPIAPLTKPVKKRNAILTRSNP